MKLISMTDFVLEQEKILPSDKDGCVKNFDAQRAFFKCINYANFLKQPLTLGMFVPCDENGNVLDRKEWTKFEGLESDLIIILEKHRQAKERVLFKGNFLIEEHQKGDYSIREENNILNFMWKFGNEDWKPAKGINTIEDLIKYNLILIDKIK